MNSKTKLRLWINALMVALVILLLANELIDNLIHELLGVFICFIIISHNIINIKWYKSISNGSYDFKRVFSMSVNILLLISVIMILLTGIITSEDLFLFLNLESSKFLQKLHIASGYWFVVLMGLHLGIHLQKLLRNIKKATSISFSIQNIYIKLSLGTFLVLFGVYSSFERNVGSKLFLHSAFDYWDFDENTLGFFIHSTSIIGLYIIISIVLLNLHKIKILKKIKKTGKVSVFCNI